MNNIPQPYNPVQIHRLLVSPPDKPFKLAKVRAGEELRILRQQNKFNSEYIRLDTIKKGGNDE
jgi:hypothetical protein